MTDCGICIGGGGGLDIRDYAASIVEARRDYRCYECERALLTGTQYEKVTGSGERGELLTYRTCLDCMNIAKGLSCNGDRLHGSLWEDLEEFGGIDSEPAFDEFSEACVAKVET